MDWDTETTSDTREILASILASPMSVLPPKTQRFGSSEVTWFEATPGKVVIMATGGTIDDRVYAETLCAIQLTPHGFKRATFTIDSPTLRKTAGWTDIMAKAKRLIQSGQVTVLRNGYNVIAGHVIGDHGEYNVEIGRDDPNSQAITTWQCECPWDQYAWQRTRQWKKFEGRPCAHVMALYWQSKAMPLDEDVTPDQAKQIGPGQRQPGSLGPPLPSGIKPHLPPGLSPNDPNVPMTPMSPMGLPRSFGPDGEIIQGDQEQFPGMGQQGPAQAPLAPPAEPGVLPPFPGDQMSLMEQWKGPGTTPGGQQSPPGAISVPGAKPQTPFNPLQNPSTYSKTAADFNPPEIVRLKNDAYGIAEGPSDEHGAGQYRNIPEGSSGEVLSQDEATGWVEVIFPLDDSGYHEPYHVRCFLEPKDLDHTTAIPPGPFIKRHR